jgi:hypothetical protein
LAGVKRSRGTRWNLDLLASGLVAAHVRLELALAENPETCQTKRAFFLKLTDHQLVELVERGLRLFLVMPILSARWAVICVSVIFHHSKAQ